MEIFKTIRDILWFIAY